MAAAKKGATKSKGIAGTEMRTGAASQNGEMTESTGTLASDASGKNAEALLKADHRKVEQLFEQFESARDEEQKSRIAQQVCTELIVHAQLEEEIFYPACREKISEGEPLDEAQVEHDGAKVLIADLLSQSADSPFFAAKVKVLKEYVRHHVAEEEKPRDGIFAQATSAGVDLQALGPRLEERKSELMALAQSDRLPPPQPRSFDLGTVHGNLYKQQENQDMERRYDQDRDEQGRFASDDDARGYSRSSRERGMRGNDRERDEQGRFVSDDERDDGRYGRGRGRDDDDDGRYARSRGRDDDDDARYARSRGRDDDDYGRSSSRSSGRGEGRGWFGDERGHSEAARRGWDERGESQRYSRGRDDDDDDRRYSRAEGRGSDDEGRGWHGDPRGHAEAARRGWDERSGSRSSRGRDFDDDNRRSSRESDRDEGDGRGWHGDPRGHAEAARRGWEERGGGSSRSSSSSSRDRDDNGNRGRNERGGSRDRGGWFGDSRGHSEAARRGWQNRDD
jgi:hemerythrin superfamily protein